MSLRLLLAGVLLLAGLVASAPTRAAATCTATADALLPFGNVNSGAAGPTSGTLNITVTCTTAALSLLATTGVRVCVGIGSGTGGSTTTPWRTMVNGSGDTHNFQLYNTSNYSQVTGLTPRGVPPAQELTMTYNVPLLTGGSGAQTLVPPQKISMQSKQPTRQRNMRTTWRRRRVEARVAPGLAPGSFAGFSFRPILIG